MQTATGVLLPEYREAEVPKEPTGQPGLLHEIFEHQADTRPNALAVEFGRERATYAELECRANRLARHLRAKGIGRGSVVAILLPRSVDAYAAMLGILKAGAAYLPLDPDFPPDRIAYVFENSGSRGLVTLAELAASYSFGGAVVCMDTDRNAIAANSAERLPHSEIGVDVRDLCYIIYTSGSTGRPKGVMIEHRSAHHLVCAEGLIYGLHADDRIYQGASLAFDLSVEEIWMAFRVGATLIPATPEMAHAGPDLSQHLTSAGITVLSAVPTLLSMLDKDIPTVRLLITGAEACPAALAARWARPGRRVVNTYGPTEATVIATYAELQPGEPVSIGRAIPGYRVYLLDDKLQPVPQGQAGEICIAGIGVARGYVGLPEETATRFLADPFAPANDLYKTMYRSGDVGRLNKERNIEFVGRADSQVKLRGFRIELSEIESALLQQEGIQAAACAVREDVPDLQMLVGYVVPQDGKKICQEQLRSNLARKLPRYMVPALIEVVPDLPLLPSGKLDRALLPPPRARSVVIRSEGRRDLRTRAERSIAAVWEALFHPQPVHADDDFFLDLGGHSLLAARMVSELRKYPEFASVSVADVYAHPTVSSLATALDLKQTRRHAHRLASVPRIRQGVSRAGEERRHFLAGVVQAVGLYVPFCLEAFFGVLPYLLYFLLRDEDYTVIQAGGWSVLCAVLSLPLLLAFAIAIKWIVLGRIQPGHYPLWGSFYLRWWFVQATLRALPLKYFARTPLLPFIYRLFGARIGKNVFLGTHRLAAFDLISIGDGTSIDDDASLTGFTVEGNELIIAPVRIGRECFVGLRAVVSEGAIMDDGARLEDLSLLDRGARIPHAETWGGSPAKPMPRANTTTIPAPVRSPLRRAATAALYAGLVPVIPLLLLCAFVPGIAVLVRLDPVAQPWLYLAVAPLVGASFVLLLTLEVVLFKWLLVGRVRPGTYPVDGDFYVRNWIVDQLLTLSLDYVGQLHATLYLAPWYRALGAKLGRFVEISTASTTTPDLIEIGDGGTIADEVSLGSARIEKGWMTLAPTSLGRRAFVGNSAVIPAGTTLGENSLIGVLSISPATPAEAARSGASWLGSPPILLPRRQASKNFSEKRTFQPTRKLRLARGAFELLRVTGPPTGFILVAVSAIRASLELYERAGFGTMLLLLPIIYAACSGLLLAVVAAIKWFVMERYRTFVRPLWSTFVWRLEFVNALFEFMAAPLVLEHLQGTPFLPWYLRLLGARIGRRTYIHTTGFLEWDLAEVGDRAVLNEDCVVQTHLFEDRVLKASRVRIGADCVVGADSVVLYDSEMEPGAQLDALSLLMKGERLPSGTAWAGLPARRCRHETEFNEAAA